VQQLDDPKPKAIVVFPSSQRLDPLRQALNL
jgi:hypothetical protein